MTIYLYALCWALAIMALAVLNVLDVIADGVAQPLFTVLPLLAVITVNARTRCLSRQSA